MSTTNIMFVIIMLALHSTLWLSNFLPYVASYRSSQPGLIYTEAMPEVKAWVYILYSRSDSRKQENGLAEYHGKRRKLNASKKFLG